LARHSARMPQQRLPRGTCILVFAEMVYQPVMSGHRDTKSLLSSYQSRIGS
ncbi:hypothetical protein LSAT2_033116, partial [Lamellibrachia satsuma]